MNKNSSCYSNLPRTSTTLSEYALIYARFMQSVLAAVPTRWWQTTSNADYGSEHGSIDLKEFDISDYSHLFNCTKTIIDLDVNTPEKPVLEIVPTIAFLIYRFQINFPKQ